MTYLPRLAAASWLDLLAELDRWDEIGRVARLWWRDDDAVAPTPQLDRLFAIAGDAPLALAVVPANAVGELAAALSAQPQISVLQHGWCHANRAADGRNTEFPPERHPVDVADELDEGRQRLRALFGPRALRLFVPPWNRFSDRFVPLLVEAGFAAISQMAPRKTVPRGIAIIDVHVDLVAWKTTRGFVGVSIALGKLIAELQERRLSGDHSAIGMLTHHLVMDGATEDFMAQLAETVAAHRAACWASADELLAA
jgi:hypothetical protein